MEFINIPAWSAREVVEWLKGLDESVHQYERQFISQNITGVQLLQFSSHYFERLNVSKVGHQQLLSDAVQHLCHLHYDLCAENLQSIALNLGVKAGDLGSYLKQVISQENNHRKDWLSSEPVLLRIAETVTAAKRIISWLDRPPFKRIQDFQVVREDILQYALALTQDTDQKKVLETSQEIKEICDNLVKKATDPLIIQTAYIEIVTLKRKKPDEELGLEIRTTALDGAHIIIAANTVAQAGRKVNLGDEVLQVNYQTVVSWDHKKVIQALIANPTEVALTLKKRPRNLNQAGQLLRPSRHNITAGGLSSLPRRKPPSNTLHPPSTKDDLYLKTLVNQQESEKKPPALQKQPSHSDPEPPEPENKLLRLHRCPTMGETVLRRPPAKKSNQTSGESRPRSLPLDTLQLDVSTEDLRHWLEKQSNKAEPHGKSAEQLTPRDPPPRAKKTVRILDQNGNSFRTGEGDSRGEGRPYSSSEISLQIPPKSLMSSSTASSAGRPGAMPVTSKSDPDVSRGGLQMMHHSNKNLGPVADETPGQPVVKRKDLSKVADQGGANHDSAKYSSGSSSEGFIYWEEEENSGEGKRNSGEKPTPTVTFKEVAVDVPADFVPAERVRPKYKVNPDYADKSTVVRRSKEKKSRRKARLSRRVTCVDLGSGECEGWLLKRNESRFQWTFMMFKLKEFVLYYYKRKDADKAKGLICLPGYTIQRHDKRDWGIKISHVGMKKTIYLAAEKESDWKKWMEHLQLASILYTEKDKVKNRKSQILPEDTDVMKVVMQDFDGYHSESDDDSSVWDDPEFHPDEVTKTAISHTFARRSLRRKSTHNVNKLYRMQTEYHPNPNLNEKLVKKQMICRTMEAKRKDIDELDKLLAQKITHNSFQHWQRDHPNLLQEIHKTRKPSEKRDYSSDEEGSVTSDKSDGSPRGSRTSLDVTAIRESPTGERKSKQRDQRARAGTSPSKSNKSGNTRGSPLQRSGPAGGARKVQKEADSLLQDQESAVVDQNRSSVAKSPPVSRKTPGTFVKEAKSPLQASKSVMVDQHESQGGSVAKPPPMSSETSVVDQNESQEESAAKSAPMLPGRSTTVEPISFEKEAESPSQARKPAMVNQQKSQEESVVKSTPMSPETSGVGSERNKISEHDSPKAAEMGSPSRHHGKGPLKSPPPTSPKPRGVKVVSPSKSSISGKDPHHSPASIPEGHQMQEGPSRSPQLGKGDSGDSGSAGVSSLKPQKPTEIDAAIAATRESSPSKKVPPKVVDRKRRVRTESETSETSV